MPIACTPSDSCVCVAGFVYLRLYFSRRVRRSQRRHTWNSTETWLVYADLNDLARKRSPCLPCWRRTELCWPRHGDTPARRPTHSCLDAPNEKLVLFDC